MSAHPSAASAAVLPDNRLREPIDTVLDNAPASWRSVIEAWRESAAGRSLVSYLRSRQAAGATIYPSDPLRALRLTPAEQVRVVILGQDPYHGPGQAEGLAFSVPASVATPPSLRNVVAELGRDLCGARGARPDLASWAKQGVLLINACLSVEQGLPASHAGKGWEALTARILGLAWDSLQPKVFMLWGAQAQAVLPRSAPSSGHLVLRANHPSPLSARRPPVPFIGCGHFGAANRFLVQVQPGAPAIDWWR